MLFREGPPLRSQFLLDIQASFLAGPRQWVRELEFEEVGEEIVSHEALAVVSKIHVRELYVYQQLTVWGDQVARFSVREDSRKRQDRVLLRVDEFALGVEPKKIVEVFQWADLRLSSLDTPPGNSEGDRRLLRAIEEEWLKISTAASQ